MQVALDFYLADGSHSVTAISAQFLVCTKAKSVLRQSLGERRHRGFAGSSRSPKPRASSTESQSELGRGAEVMHMTEYAPNNL
jgi:hypothetical protein